LPRAPCARETLRRQGEFIQFTAFSGLSRRCALAPSERSCSSLARYSGVTSPVTYSPEKHEVSNSRMLALSWRQAAIDYGSALLAIS